MRTAGRMLAVGIRGLRWEQGWRTKESASGAWKEKIQGTELGR